MQKAAFSLIKYQFDKVNINLSNHLSNEISLVFDTKTKGVYEQKTSTFQLIFSIKAFNENNIENPFVEVECKGEFKFEEVASFEEIPNYFYGNCIAILFPYVRAYVSMITTQANVPSIILPTLNLSSLEDALKQNTTQL